MSESLLSVENISKTFYKNNENHLAVDDMSFKIYEGECVGLVGESGCGKSTISKMITRLISSDSGNIIYKGNDISKLNKRNMSKIRSEIQMIFQNPKDSFNPRMKLVDSVSEGLKHNTNLNKQERVIEVKKAFEKVGLKEDYLNRYINGISGGECQRAAIARSILIKPQLLICDEVTSALDVSVQAQIVSLLNDLKKELNMSYLFITHDLALVTSICDRVIVMYKGSEVESGYTHDIFSNPHHPYTKLLLSCIMTVEKNEYLDVTPKLSEEETNYGCKFKECCPERIGKCDREMPKIKFINDRRVRCHLYR